MKLKSKCNVRRGKKRNSDLSSKGLVRLYAKQKYIEDVKQRGVQDDSEDALAKHKQRYTCPLCQRSFLWLGHLKRHLRTHEGKKFFKCRECHFTTTRKCTLAKHSVTHMKQAPFKCPDCPEEFATKAALLRHINAAHCDPKQQQQQQKKKKKKHSIAGKTLYQCPECAYASRQRKDFMKHLLTHMQKKRYGRRCCVVKFPERKDDLQANSR
ncbi:Blast:Zinc finger protein Xfin, partial [Gryllus bimaculatus]